MAETTSHSDELTREEAASYLRDLADALEDDADEIAVPVGNKRVTLRPPNELSFNTEVRERSRLVGRRKEAVTVELDWSVRKK